MFVFIVPAKFSDRREAKGRIPKCRRKNISEPMESYSPAKTEI